MDEVVSLFGLGFGSSGEPQNGTASSNNDSTTDALMKHYLQQCLDYHDQQQQQQEALESPSEVPLEFVSAAQKEKTPPPVISDPPLAPTNSYIVNPADAAHQAMAKARAIVQKFQQQQQILVQGGTPLDGAFSATDSTTTPSPLEFRQRRERHFESERQRLHKAMLKNFHYVERREEERLQLQLQQIQQSRQVEAQLQQKYNNVLEQRQKQQKAITSSKAGIGTNRRHALDQKQRKEQPRIHASNKTDSSVALYLSGLPADGSMTEDTVRQLFTSYGKICKVHLYRNKATGELKGDALVVYELSSDKSGQNMTHRREFLDSVCSQMTGAQLPCGNVLHVEPADSDYKEKQSAKKEEPAPVDGDMSYYGPASLQKSTAGSDTAEMVREATTQTVASEMKDEQIIAQKATEDLDDFFASLT